MVLPKINTASITTLCDKATDRNLNGAPGVVFQCIDRDGRTLASTASGFRKLTDSQPMTTDTTFYIASCTKLVTSIACMQLVERRQADLDDPGLVAKVLPEVKAARVFDGEKEVPQKGNITLRMLLTHTAGFSYTFLWTDFWNCIGQDEDADEFQGSFDAFKQPLKFQPGQHREYSIGIDWVGVFIERTSGLSLGEYFQTNIFKPLGMTSTDFILSASMRSRLASMHYRDANGKLHVRKHLNKAGRELDVGPNFFHSGGAGLFSTGPDYCQIIAALLNDGVSPLTNNRILKSSTVDQMFENQIPDWETKYASAGGDISRPDLAPIALREEQQVIGRQGWGLSFLLTGDRLQVGTAPGICNTFWILDREKGVGGVLFSQILPLGDPPVSQLWTDLIEVILT